MEATSCGTVWGYHKLSVTSEPAKSQAKGQHLPVLALGAWGPCPALGCLKSQAGSRLGDSAMSSAPTFHGLLFRRPVLGEPEVTKLD